MPVKCSVYALTYYQQQFLKELYQKPGQKAKCTHLTGLFTIPRAESLERYGYLKFVEEAKQTTKRKGKRFDRTVKIYKLTVAGRNQVEHVWPTLAVERDRKKEARKPKPTKEEQLKQQIAGADRAIAVARKDGDQVWDNTRKRSLPVCPTCKRRGEKRKATHITDHYTHRGYVSNFGGFAMNHVVDSCTNFNSPAYEDDALNTRFPTLLKAGVRLFDLRFTSAEKVAAIVAKWGEKHPRLIKQARVELTDFTAFANDGRDQKKGKRS